MEALRASETKYRNLFTRAAEGIFQVDLQDRVVDTNPALAAMFGYSSPQEMINSAEKISEIVVHPEERKRLVDLLMQQNAVDRYEIEVFRKDGHRIWVSVSAHTVRNDQGEIQYFEGMCLDITKQKKAQEEILALNSHLEQRVQERTAQFEASNHELEAFASSVSHDLKSPLRSIKGFSQALMEDFGNILPPEGQDQLQRVLNESTRMENLIEDLLRLAHVGEQDLILDEVDISAMTSSLAKSLAEANPERKVSWEVEPGIVVHGDPVLMRVLMDNLLSNAWKFTSRSAEAKIRVVRLASEPGWTDFAVEDNGVGFEPANTNRLFTPFQRMHSSSEFPGTGIGLAIVRRIANRHGAHVSAHGKPGEGARILLSFPNRGNGPTETWS